MNESELEAAACEVCAKKDNLKKRDVRMWHYIFMKKLLTIGMIINKEHKLCRAFGRLLKPEAH